MVSFNYCQFVGTLVAYNCVDKVGRRRLLLTGTFGLGTVFSILAVSFSGRTGFSSTEQSVSIVSS